MATTGRRRGLSRPGVSKRQAEYVAAVRANVELAHAAAIEEGWARAYAARQPEAPAPACGSGWTGDRCRKALGHRGLHSNERGR